MQPVHIDAADDGLALLVQARESLERAALDAPLVPADRDWIVRAATRIGELVEAMQAASRPMPKTPPATVTPAALPEAMATRKAAARRLGVSPNTLLNWEARGLLAPRRNASGWRVYGAAEIARGLAILRHVPPDELP